MPAMVPSQTAEPATAAASSDSSAPPREHEHLRMLMLANPKQFAGFRDGAPQSGLHIAGDTRYEEIECAGLSPALHRLQAVVSLKQSSGYQGGICAAGSQEYVRFYLCFDGEIWLDQGVAGFTARNMPALRPLSYGVAVAVTLPQDFCCIESVAKMRAILSWNTPPPPEAPNFVPVWGDVTTVEVQSPAADFIRFSTNLTITKCLLASNMARAVGLSQKIASATRGALRADELMMLYEGTEVSPGRYLYPHIDNLTGSDIPAGLPALRSTTARLSAGEPSAIDLGPAITELLSIRGDSTYEKLRGVGLDINRRALVAVLRVNLPLGFNGGVDTAGSTLYVAFWVDWGAGDHRYVGTAALDSRDAEGFPAQGLDYAVALPIDLAAQQKSRREGEHAAAVSAILSWGTPPPPAEPGYMPVWGDRAEARIQVPPWELPIGADIAVIGGIGADQIALPGSGYRPGMTLPASTALPFGAMFALQGTPANSHDHSRQCGFHGEIMVQGSPVFGHKYRVMVRQIGKGFSAAAALTHPIVTTDQRGDKTTRIADSRGYFDYLPSARNIDDILAIWPSKGSDLYQIWLETLDPSDGSMAYGPTRQIQLCASAPEGIVDSTPGLPAAHATCRQP